MTFGLWLNLNPKASKEDIKLQESVTSPIKDLETPSEKRAEFNSAAERFASVYNNKKGFYVTETLRTKPREEALQIIQDRIRELEEFLYEPQIEAIALRDLYSETIKHATEQEKEYLRKRDATYKPKPQVTEGKPKLTPFETAVKVLMDTMEKIGQPINKDEAIRLALAQGIKKDE